MQIEATPRVQAARAPLRGAAKRASEAASFARGFALGALFVGLLFGVLPGLAVVLGVFDELGLYGTVACIGSAFACFAAAAVVRRL